MADGISIHVLGYGFGESIILSLPNGKVGVIDCFSPVLKAADSAARLQANPTLRFLRNDLHTDRLAFLGFTHPHEDHGRGLSHLLQEYKDRIDEIWIFEAFQDMYLERYFAALFNAKRKLPIERLLLEEPGTFSVELVRIRNLVMRQIATSNAARAVPRVFAGPQSVRIAGEPVVFHFLGPSVALAQQYKAKLIENLTGVVNDNGDVVNTSWKHDTVNHNMASPSFLVEYGASRFLLGGDMEGDGWTEVQRDHADSAFDFAVAFVKVSHHGSTTGFVAGLYEQFGRTSRPTAVLTPFNRHRSPLPERAGVDHLEARTSQLWATSLADARRSLGVEEQLTIDELTRCRPILERWKRDLESQPASWGALDPDFVMQMGSASVPAVLRATPNEWIPDLLAEPRLATLLHPTLRSAYLPQLPKTEPFENAYRMSFTFRDDGTEIPERRHVGSGCGRLS